MANRKQNMLEAFRQSSLQEEEAARRKAEEEALLGVGDESVSEPQARPAHGAATAGGGAQTRPRRELRGPLGLSTSDEDDGPRLLTVPAQMLGPFALLQLLLLVLAFWVGRASASNSDALASSGSVDAGPELPVAQGLDASGPLGADGVDPALAEQAELAFRDPANRYSVRVVQFPAGEYGRSLAYNSYDYLLGQGIPAIRPMQKGEAIVVCVGAGPVPAEMNALRDRVRGLAGPDPKDPYPYQTAYCVNIDELIRR